MGYLGPHPHLRGEQSQAKPNQTKSNVSYQPWDPTLISEVSQAKPKPNQTKPNQTKPNQIFLTKPVTSSQRGAKPNQSKSILPNWGPNPYLRGQPSLSYVQPDICFENNFFQGLFAAANIFSSLKLVYIFSVNPYLGPLQVKIKL